MMHTTKPVHQQDVQPRILHVLNSAGIGGGAKQVASLIHGLPDLVPSLICFDEGPLINDLRARGVHAEIVPLAGTRLQPHRLPRLLAAVRRLKPHILHCHGTRAAFNVACIRPFLGDVRLVYTERGFAYQPHASLRRRLWGRLVETFNGRSFEWCVCVSQADLDWAVRRGLFLRDRCSCIHNGIAVQGPPDTDQAGSELRQLVALPEGAEIILTIGRVETEKSPDDVIEMMRSVHAARPNAHLVWIGGGRLLQQTRARSRQAGLDSVCHFPGEQAEATRYIADCDVFILASLWEGLPNVLLEALLAERPCAATAVNGVPEILLDGITGRCVPARRPKALATAVIELLSRKDMAAALARAGAEHELRNFRMESTLERYRELYSRLLAGTGIQLAPAERALERR